RRRAGAGVSAMDRRFPLRKRLHRAAVRDEQPADFFEASSGTGEGPQARNKRVISETWVARMHPYFSCACMLLFFFLSLVETLLQESIELYEEALPLELRKEGEQQLKFALGD